MENLPRVMATGSDVELIDRPDGNQFVARIWRTTPKAATEREQSQAGLDFVEHEQARPKVKDEITTQKANEELISTTQKEEDASQKSETTTQKPLNANQKEDSQILEQLPKSYQKGCGCGIVRHYGRWCEIQYRTIAAIWCVEA